MRKGFIVRCADGTLSRAGGKQGACSHHGGVECAIQVAVAYARPSTRGDLWFLKGLLVMAMLCR